MGDFTEYKFTPVERKFVDWLQSQGYEPAVEVCPYDSEEGGYLFSTSSYDLIDEFKSAFPEYRDTDDADIVPDDGLWDEVSNDFSGGPDDGVLPDDTAAPVAPVAPLSAPCQDMTLEEARNRLQVQLDKGAACPCCEQFAKIYKRKLYSAMARGLLWLVREYLKTRDWVQSPATVMAHGLQGMRGDFAKLVYWELIFSRENDDDTKRTSGFWKPTQRGIDFAQGRIEVPAHVYLYDGKLVRFSDETIRVVDVVDDFDYSEVMQVETESLDVT